VPVTKVVHVTAAAAADPVLETAWLQRMADADELGWPNGIVAAVDLSASDVRSTIERHLEFDNFRGARDVTLPEHLGEPALDNGLQVLAEHGLACEAMTRLPRFPALAATADRNPDVTFVLGHGGTPMERSEEFLSAWRAGLDDLAERPNVVCKVSGFGIGDNTWTVASLEPMVQGCIDAFGPDRCIFNGNWPVDRLYSTYDELFGAFDALTADCTADERDAMFAANAERVYRI
jgi:predicted TIM-barrel fold metal-dependent hydrolase